MFVAKPIEGFPKVVTRDQPVLVPTGGEIGKNATAELTSRSGDIYILALGLVAETPTPESFHGDLWLSPVNLGIVASGKIGAGGKVVLTRKVPNRTSLRGQTVGVQALAGPLTGPISFSNLGVIILR